MINLYWDAPLRSLMQVDDRLIFSGKIHGMRRNLLWLEIDYDFFFRFNPLKY